MARENGRLADGTGGTICVRWAKRQIAKWFDTASMLGVTAVLDILPLARLSVGRGVAGQRPDTSGWRVRIVSSISSITAMSCALPEGVTVQLQCGWVDTE